MYEAAYGLHTRPFALPPDPGFLFLGKSHREALAHLVYGVRERTGFVQLTGEVGTGKTLLARALLERLPGDVDTAWLYRPTDSVEGFVAAILRELGETPADGADSNALVDQLNRRLLAAHARGRTTVLLIDEAQTLDSALIEQVRLLTNLETRREKLLQILLVGQPELRDLLARPALRQVAQRITARYHLRALSRDEARAYVRHRLRMAGGDENLFTAPAMRTLYRASGGIPRLVNVVADRALLGAYGDGARRVRWQHVRRAARELEHEHRRPRRWPWAAAAGAAVIIAAAGLWFLRPVGGNDATEQLDSLASIREYAAYRHPGEAVAALADRQGVAAGTADGDIVDCGALDGSGFVCLHLRGDWQALTRLRRPALLELDTGDSAIMVLADGITAGQARLYRDTAAHTASRDVLAPAWRGDFMVLWHPPALTPIPASVGDRGEAVRWLRERLDAEAPPDLQAHFDRRLAERLGTFQRRHGLPDHGRLDRATLLYLLESPDPAMEAR